MRQASLWSDTDAFLSQPHVRAVLEELGVDEPAKLVERLLVEVRRRIITSDSGGPHHDELSHDVVPNPMSLSLAL